jgi:hypothetical protein
MLYLHSFKSGTAALLALIITSSAVVPIVTTSPAFAQSRYPRRQQTQTNRVVPSGTSIAVRYDKAEKVVVMPDERMALTLTVAKDVIARDGRVLIPQGSEIVGDLTPVSGGTQFIARADPLSSSA